MASGTHSVNNVYNLIPEQGVTLNYSQELQNSTRVIYPVFGENHLFIINILLMTLSFFGNAYIIVFICKQKRARNAHNISMISMAVADLVISLIVMPSYITVHDFQKSVLAEEKQPLDMTATSPFLCKFQNYLFYWCKTVKIYSVVAMTIDRYYRITMPTRNFNLSGRCIFFLTLVWFFGSAFNIWQLILTSSSIVRVVAPGYNISVRSCVPASDFYFLQTSFVVSTLLVTYGLPIVTLAYCYGLIILKSFALSHRKLPLKSKRRLVLSVLAGFVFYMCHLPGEVLHYRTLAPLQQNSTLELFTLRSVLDSFSFSQGLLNVVCYLCCSTELHLSCAAAFSLPYCSVHGGRPQGELTHTPRGSGSTRAIQILVTAGSSEAMNPRH